MNVNLTFEKNVALEVVCRFAHEFFSKFYANFVL